MSGPCLRAKSVLMALHSILPDEIRQLLWHDGYDAYTSGHAIGLCPHRQGSDMQVAWIAGWDEAKRLATTPPAQTGLVP